LRRVLRSADRLSEAAINFAPLNLNTPDSRSRASLCAVTPADHRVPALFVEALRRLSDRFDFSSTFLGFRTMFVRLL
jgi:hypothetical protein